MKQVPMWEAFDGKPFTSEAAAAQYERDHAPQVVAYLLCERPFDEAVDMIEAAISRADLTLADAIENVARRIKKVRLANGARDPAPGNGEPADGSEETRADGVAA